MNQNKRMNRWSEIKERARLAWRILTSRDGNLLRHALRETPVMGADEMGLAMQRHMRDMVRCFSQEGHSGASASYAISALAKLLDYKPLAPLTGEDSEWIEVGEGFWQNVRCGRVFKGADGQAYDSEGIVWKDDVGCFINLDSRVYVTFPYTPKTEYRRRSPETTK